VAPATYGDEGSVPRKHVTSNPKQTQHNTTLIECHNLWKIYIVKPHSFSEGRVGQLECMLIWSSKQLDVFLNRVVVDELKENANLYANLFLFC
jgi:hypothetical protein